MFPWRWERQQIVKLWVKRFELEKALNWFSSIFSGEDFLQSVQVIQLMTTLLERLCQSITNENGEGLK